MLLDYWTFISTYKKLINSLLTLQNVNKSFMSFLQLFIILLQTHLLVLRKHFIWHGKCGNYQVTFFEIYLTLPPNNQSNYLINSKI